MLNPGMPQQQQQVQQLASDQQKPCSPPSAMPLPASQPEPSHLAPQFEPSDLAPQPKPADPAPQPESARPAPQPEPTRPVPQPEPVRPAPQPKPSHLAPQPEVARPAPQPEPSPPTSPAGTFVEDIDTSMLNMNLNLPRVMEFGVLSFTPGDSNLNYAASAGLKLTISGKKQLYKDKRHEDTADRGHSTNKRPKVNEEPQQATGFQENRSIQMKVSRITCKEILVGGRKGVLMTVNWSSASGDSAFTVESATKDAAVQTSDELQTTVKVERPDEKSNLQPTVKDEDGDKSEGDF